MLRWLFRKGGAARTVHAVPRLAQVLRSLFLLLPVLRVDGWVLMRQDGTLRFVAPIEIDAVMAQAASALIFSADRVRRAEPATWIRVNREPLQTWRKDRQ